MASARISNFRINNINSDEKKYLAEQQKRNILKQINNLTQKSSTLLKKLYNKKSNTMFKSVIDKFNVDIETINDNIKKYESIKHLSRDKINRRNDFRRKTASRNTASGYTNRSSASRNTANGYNNRNIGRNNRNNRNNRRNTVKNTHIKFNILNNKSIDNIPKEIRNSMRKDNIDRIVKQYIGFDIINQLIKCREYTETQESYFCAAHSLNNLFGSKIFIHDSKNKIQKYIKLYDYAIEKKILVDVKTGDYEIDIFTIINSTPFLKDYNIDLYNNNDVLFNEGILSDPKLVGFICYSGTHYYVIKKYDNNVFILIDSNNFNGEKKAICIKGDHNSVFTHLDYLQEILGPQGIYRFGIVMHK